MPRLPDDAQIERIAQLLEQRAVPFKGFNLEALDGYLSAIALSPEPVPAEAVRSAASARRPGRFFDAILPGLALIAARRCGRR